MAIGQSTIAYSVAECCLFPRYVELMPRWQQSSSLRIAAESRERQSRVTKLSAQRSDDTPRDTSFIFTTKSRTIIRHLTHKLVTPTNAFGTIRLL